MPPPALALRDAALGFGGRPLFEGLSLGLAADERACLVGRNGSGKSSLLKVLAGEIELDRGTRFVQPGLKVAYLPQDPQFSPDTTVAAHVAAGLADEATPGDHRIDAVLAHLDLDGARSLQGLSGGEGRRVALARALVGDPDVLLLDEPTNHLDLPTIEWLEAELGRFRGALLMISHDRAFLEKLSRATLWLDRGALRRLERSFAAFDDWAETLQAEEARDLHRLNRTIKREERWLARGVTARRRRNQGRLARLQALRQARADWLRAPGTAKIEAAASDSSGDLVIEAEGLSKAFESETGERRNVLRDVSTRIKRGDRIGIIGANGSGKTTLVRLLTGSLPPDAGQLRLGTGLAPLYFDQRRERLDPEATLWRSLAPDGGDSLMVRGRQRHVVAYLRDFLFEEEQARQPVKRLSGGEKNRLLLARLFAKPSNLLILDEPTNDLDMETLDLLTETLDGYEGTLLLVSHDRDFLDRLVTGVIALEGDGRARDYVGGYADYLRQREAKAAPRTPAAPRPKTDTAKPKAESRARASKLSYKEARELDTLPAKIDALTHEIQTLEAKLSDSAFYSREPAAFREATSRLEQARQALDDSEARWLELEERREALAAGRDVPSQNRSESPAGDAA